MQTKGFTLLEMIVVILIIGVTTSLLLPRLFRRSPQIEWPNILDDMNNIVFFARQEAIAGQKVHRLVFESNPQGADSITVEQEEDDPEKPGQKIYQQVESYYFQTKHMFAEEIKIKAVYIGKLEMLSELRGRAYCYVVPNGLVQEVIVHLARNIRGIQTQGSYKVQPFLGKFQFHEGWLRSER